MNDRRQPLGGVKRETFVHAANNDSILSAELTYDLIVGIKSDLCHEIKKIQCQPDKCDKRYIKKVWEKLPISKYELIAYLLFIGILIGMKVIPFTAIAKWLP